MQPRLKAEIWVTGHIRRCYALDMPAYLRHRGDRDAGGILLKINRFEAGCELLEPTMDRSGQRAWMRASGPEPIDEAEADAAIARRLKTDPDLWVVEIEDRDGRHALDEPIL